MDPQTPEVPIVPSPEPPKPKDSHWVTILAMALFVLAALSITAFLYYQNQSLKKMLASYQIQTSPTLSPISDPTANWKEYTNSTYKFSFMYPQNFTLEENKLTSEIQIILNKGTENSVTFGASINYPASQPKYFLGATSDGVRKIGEIEWQTFYLPDGYQDAGDTNTSPIYALQLERNKILYSIQGFTSRNLTNEQLLILSTFGFLEASPTAEPKACTMEAKLCPDGSYVGREGPNCEFAPCP